MVVCDIFERGKHDSGTTRVVGAAEVGLGLVRMLTQVWANCLGPTANIDAKPPPNNEHPVTKANYMLN